MADFPENINDLNTVIKLVESHADLNKQYGFYTETILQLACRCNWINIAKYLIANGADINKPDPFLNTPLHDAARGGHLDIVKCLLENGADKFATNQHLRTASGSAARVSRHQIAKYIDEFELMPTKGVHLD